MNTDGEKNVHVCAAVEMRMGDQLSDTMTCVLICGTLLNCIQ